MFKSTRTIDKSNLPEGKQASKKKVKAPDVTFPTWEIDNAHAACLLHLQATQDHAILTPDVAAIIVATAKRIVKLGEKKAKASEKIEARLKTKLAKLAEESKKAGIDLQRLLG